MYQTHTQNNWCYSASLIQNGLGLCLVRCHSGEKPCTRQTRTKSRTSTTTEPPGAKTYIDQHMEIFSSPLILKQLLPTALPRFYWLNAPPASPWHGDHGYDQLPPLHKSFFTRTPSTHPCEPRMNHVYSPEIISLTSLKQKQNSFLPQIVFAQL
jgi:hypothetical protein